MSSVRLALLLLFVAFPLLEIALLIKSGETIGFWPTVTLLVAVAVLGVMVIRDQGPSMVGRMLAAMSEGKLPFGPLIEGYVVVTAGLLLIAPGFISDAIGLFLLIPPARRLALRAALRGFAGRPPGHETRARVARPTVIEGTYERLDERDAGRDDDPLPR